MPIKRIGSNPTDYKIDLDFSFSGEKYKWSKSKNPKAAYFGGNPSKIIELEQEKAKIKPKKSLLERIYSIFPLSKN